MNKASEKRLFVAVRLPPEVKRALAVRCEELGTRWRFSKWVHQEDYHVTVQFLGSVDQDRMGPLAGELARAAAKHQPFELAVAGIGTFGRPEQPRILWAGLTGDLGKLRALQSTVARHLETVGFPPEQRPYRPHVTVARKCLDTPFSLNAGPSWGEEAEKRWRVDELALMETRLGERPMYRVVGRFALGTGKRLPV
ncbi:RNA 2',3'-cyclic phosphodiesterase [Staphylospora marina]|uniref:RNA 2',3'-cyclic phosphodiesterase n=1 Tax=Staphylospora marina TaxID=2490858 RepID=UPI000F5BA549|nr:RNA 2',3'-cyclic phosphodiesterase [Staphylospora marina]